MSKPLKSRDGKKLKTTHSHDPPFPHSISSGSSQSRKGEWAGISFARPTPNVYIDILFNIYLTFLYIYCIFILIHILDITYSFYMFYYYLRNICLYFSLSSLYFDKFIS